MKKVILALCLFTCALISGCSSASQNSVSTTSDDEATAPQSEEDFYQKCANDVQALKLSMSSSGYDIKVKEPDVQYEGDSPNKIYVLEADGADNKDRILVGYMDIYYDDEYKYFLSAKNFINYIKGNAIEISGSDQYWITINKGENGLSDIFLSHTENQNSIIYRDRSIRSAYSERFKSIDGFADYNESLALPGLLLFDDLPGNIQTFDVTVRYNNKDVTHKWYKVENGEHDINFVTYIDDGTYENVSDDELVYYAYNAIYDSELELSEYSFYDFYLANKSGEVQFSLFYSPRYGDLSYAYWLNEYEQLNSNQLNKSLLEEFKK